MSTPLEQFKTKLSEFASGQRRGIRNPFVIVPVAPDLEWAVVDALVAWAPSVPTTKVYLDRIMPKTDVFATVAGLSPAPSKKSIETTFQRNLAREMVELIIKNHEAGCQTEEHILLLLQLGSLYPFTRASALLDEMDRRRVRATVGIPFPGSILSGKLSFFDEQAQHYYPAHRIDTQIQAAHLQG